LHQTLRFLDNNNNNNNYYYYYYPSTATEKAPKKFMLSFTVAVVALLVVPSCRSFVPNSLSSRDSRLSASPSSSSANEALQRTFTQLERLKREQPRDADSSSSEENDPVALYQSLIREPANSLKAQLKERHLPTKGRKPDLAQRLVDYELKLNSMCEDADESPIAWDPSSADGDQDNSSRQRVNSFAGLRLSEAAGRALGQANFRRPTAIQQAVIPMHMNGESLIMHAETGSGKSLAYLLPITEQMWLEHDQGIVANGQFSEDQVGGYAFILTPTRELAAQVAGIASVLAPPGTVRMVSRPTNLMSDGLRDQGEEAFGGRLDKGDGRTKARLFVGSAKAIMHSLYGDGKMPASPTRKPEAMKMLQNTRWVVLDEVDRLLNVKKTRGNTSGNSKNKHEKPAAVVTAAAARMTFGRAQVVAASATVGRSLKREMARVLGLSPQEAPAVVRANGDLKDEEEYTEEENVGRHVGRAVTIPDTVKHYITAVDTSSTGKLLTNAVYVLKALRKTKSKRILMVLAKGCGINTQNAIGALKHFQCDPEPMSLLDVLEADGTERMMQVHREVTGATGVGESTYFSTGDESDSDGEESADEGAGYLLVTGEDTIRGLHLDGLDVVLVVGKADGPDEYTHIAGRTGRAGRTGKVINVVSEQHAATVAGWEKMLSVKFHTIDVEDVEKL
jgi:superfamily II DNA/RNA helicase